MSDETCSFKTEFEFKLPRGYIDREGTCHKHGTIRLGTAGDEIKSAADPRVISNPAYLTIILLSRVITKLGKLEKDQINPKVVEDLFVSDLNYLRKLYQRFNFEEEPKIQTTCPKCDNKFLVDINKLD
jgi:hypothetical protein